MEIREELRYSRTHQWMREQDGQVLVGITDYAQAELQSLVFVTLPEAGDTVTAGKPFAEVESVKVVSDVISPVSGVISEINEELLDMPEKINEVPYDAWLVRVKDVTETVETLSAEEYQAYLETLQHA